MFVQEIDAARLQEMLGAGEDLKLIDVRSAGEAARGMLPNAEFLPLHTLPARISDIPRDKTVVFYCRSGARSAQACAFLMAQGFDNVINLRGGVMDWARYGFPMVQPVMA